MAEIRFGIIGGGMMGLEHAGNLLALRETSGATQSQTAAQSTTQPTARQVATLTAVADPHPLSRQSIQALCQQSGSAPVAEFEDHHELLRSGLCDAVILATPNMTHADILCDILETDLHVLVEKPLCDTVEACLDVIDKAEAADYNSVIWVGLEYRYMAPIARLLEVAKSGSLGQLRMVAVREHRFPFLEKVENWNRFNRNTGGTMVEKCCHFFDLMDEIMQARPEQVFASGGHDVNHKDESYGGERPDILDNAYVILDYPGGTRGMLDLCMFAEATRNQEEVVVVGDKGKAEAFVPEDIVRVGYRGQHNIGDVMTETAKDKRIAFEGGHHGSSYLEVVAFIEAIQNNTPAEVSLEDGLWSVATGSAARLSIEKNRPVSLSELLPQML